MGARAKAACCGLALLLLVPGTGRARDFRLGELEGLVDFTLAYGLLVRTEERDEELIGIANGGSARSVNFDDGNLNYGVGVASNMLKGSGELTLRWRSLGAHVRAIGFYDFENSLFERQRTPLSGEAKWLVGRAVEARDYYVTGQFHAGGVPIQLRVGNQVITWGETNFLRLGVDVINPIDPVAILQPATTPRDLFLPQGMIWGVANLTETLAFEAFYQYDWRATTVAPVGSYFSINDTFGGDGTNFAMLGDGFFSDLGTDLDEAFGLPPGTLGFDEDFLKVPGRGRDTPAEQGQFGFALQAIVPQLNATKLGLHFVNYHSRLPLVSGLTADANAVSDTSQAAVDAQAAVLAPIYESEGLSPEEADAAAQATASQLTVSGLANESGYFAEYPRNVKMLGLTFNTATIRTGTLVAGEVSHHFDFPFQVYAPAVLGGALSPLEFDPAFGQGPLGRFGPDEVVTGFIRRGKTQVSLSLTQLFGPRLGAARTVFSFDLGWVHVHDMPDVEDLPLNAPGLTSTGDPDRPLPLNRFPTADSLGYRLLAQLTYTSVFGGLNISPRVLFTHDPLGVTPGPFSAFIEDRMTVNVGVGVDYLSTWTADLSYTSIFGAGRYNVRRDRDFLRFNVVFHY